eukprot:CAMPEP_0118891362 /NCGR_PEP_ID=MMETSP1166-20130328/1418_1 /TAXON_ID=1104430 /ORGANISM="Chrysoreinhardia sp, Strain CCMP3193" /LENGTH=559 /DNA_ID=CAMNT_0006830021 /DNA_START=129 /DNA_END=1808 /DNA_ORIENTATION=+
MSQLRRARTKRRAEALEAAAKASGPSADEAKGFLVAEEATERTRKVGQSDIRREVALAATEQAWTLKLPGGVRGVRCSRNGRFGLCFSSGSSSGSSKTTTKTSVLDLTTKGRQDVEVGEGCRDGTFLQDESMFALAQEKFVYVYDRAGTELHRLKAHVDPLFLEFLPYHSLLASIGRSGFLKYLDVSTGSFVSEHRTKTNARTSDLNSQTAVLHLGQHNGVVSFWSPAQPRALAKVLCHRGAVTAVANDGLNTLVTAGVDSTVKFWDIRSFKADLAPPLRRNNRATLALAVSQRGLLAVVNASGVDVFDCRSGEGSGSGSGKEKIIKNYEPYLSHRSAFRSTLGATFRPFEDVLLCGYDGGLQSLLVPGASEPFYDALEGLTPFRNKAQRHRDLVRGLLDKLPPETIDLAGPTFVGEVAPSDAERQDALRRRAARAEGPPANDLLKDDDDDDDTTTATSEKKKESNNAKKREKKKTRGRSKLKAKLKKKAKNIISVETTKLREKLQAQDASKARTNARKRKKKNKKEKDDDNPDDDIGTNTNNNKRRKATATSLDRLFD